MTEVNNPDRHCITSNKSSLMNMDSLIMSLGGSKSKNKRKQSPLAKAWKDEVNDELLDEKRLVDDVKIEIIDEKKVSERKVRPRCHSFDELFRYAP